MFQTDFEASKFIGVFEIYHCYELIRVITIMLDKMEIRNKSIYNTLYWNRWFIIVAGILI